MAFLFLVNLPITVASTPRLFNKLITLSIDELLSKGDVTCNVAIKSDLIPLINSKIANFSKYSFLLNLTFLHP